MPRPRAIFYVDGFNLYNGLVRRSEARGLDATEHRWLDIHKLATFLAPECQVVLVRYFTSRVKRRIDNEGAELRQEIFLRALRTLPNFTIHEGKFQRNRVWRRLADNPDESVRVVDFKEKGSDANLAAYLVHDALRDECETACVISADSDLVVPIALANAALRGGVVAFSPNVGRPPRGFDRVTAANHRINDRTLAACHLPAGLRDTVGEIHKPESW